MGRVSFSTGCSKLHAAHQADLLHGHSAGSCSLDPAGQTITHPPLKEFSYLHSTDLQPEAPQASIQLQFLISVMLLQKQMPLLKATWCSFTLLTLQLHSIHKIQNNHASSRGGWIFSGSSQLVQKFANQWSLRSSLPDKRLRY